MKSIFIQSIIIMLGYSSFWFVVSIIKKRNDIADIAWGLGYLILCGFHAVTQALHPVVLLCYFLILIWSLRLSGFIYMRNRNKPEDFRYHKWRMEWGGFFYFRSFIQVYVLQAALLLVIISPVLHIASFSGSTFSLYSVFGSLIWIIGFYWQVIGDSQLKKFVRNKSRKEEIIQTGLWKYSRHPNYFGEVLMWWGLYVICWPFQQSIYFIIGPITITLLIRYVSGVPMMERRFKNNKAYQEYKSRVPVLFPWFRNHP